MRFDICTRSARDGYSTFECALALTLGITMTCGLLDISRQSSRQTDVRGILDRCLARTGADGALEAVATCAERFREIKMVEVLEVSVAIDPRSGEATDVKPLSRVVRGKDVSVPSTLRAVAEEFCRRKRGSVVSPCARSRVEVVEDGDTSEFFPETVLTVARAVTEPEGETVRIEIHREQAPCCREGRA